MNPLAGTLGRIEATFFRLLEHLMVLLLSAMALMVFCNVVLRRTVNSGIDVSEESIKVTLQRARTYGLEPRVHAQVMSIESMAYQSNWFD